VEQRRVTVLLREAHIFCYPTSASEGFPKVVLEALASGLPVITTRVSVLPLLIGSGCGILLEETDARFLAKAVIELGSDTSRYSQMSAKALETAREFSLEKWRDSIGAVLRESWKETELRSASINPELISEQR